MAELILFCIFAFCLGGFMHCHEKIIWNNGVCKKNGKEWKYFDTASDGSRGFEAGDEVYWFSWCKTNQ